MNTATHQNRGHSDPSITRCSTASPPTEASAVSGSTVEQQKYIDDNIYQSLLQDVGQEKTSDGSKPNGSYCDGNRVYRGLYTLAKKLLINLEEGGFISRQKNVSHARSRVAKSILALRKWSVSSDATGDASGRYVLDQERIVGMICAYWSPSGGATVDPTYNDRIRLVGILLDDEFATEYDIILGHYTASRNRQDIDNPAMRRNEAWARLTIPFNNEQYNVVNPQLWVSAEDKLGYEELNPNDSSRFAINRDGKWLSKLYKTTVAEYRVAFEKYSKGTGGGPDDPADFSDWQNRDPITFERYGGGKLYLTWIYMKDKEAGYRLCSKHNPIPHGVDGNTSSDPTNLSSRRSSPLTTFVQQSAQQMSDLQSSFKEMCQNMNRASATDMQTGVVHADKLKETMDKLEQVNRLKRSFDSLPEGTEDERNAKRKKLGSLLRVEDRLCKELDDITSRDLN